MTQPTSTQGSPIEVSLNKIATALAGNGQPQKSPSKKQGIAHLTADLNLELLQIVTARLDEQQMRSRLRTLAIRFAPAMGCCHLTRDESGTWEVKPQFATGRTPRREDVNADLAKRCDEVIQRGAVQTDPLPNIAGHYGIFYPIHQFGMQPEVLLLLLNDQLSPKNPLLILERIAEVLKLCAKNLASRSEDWKLNSLSSMVELVSQIENCVTLDEAMNLVVNELARHLGCSSVAIVADDGSRKKSKTFVSGSAKIETSSQAYHAYVQCLAEVTLRDTAGYFPAEEKDNHLLLAHSQLASELHAEAIVSQPLATIESKPFGAWLFTGPSDIVHSVRFKRFVNAISPRVANALDAVARAEHPKLVRFWKNLPTEIKKRRTKICASVAGICLVILLLPLPYRVRCDCTVEPTARRFAVAPYDGIVNQGFVRPGDHVSKDQLLAEMDGRSLRYELVGVVAEREKYETQRAINLADEKIPELLIAQLEGEKRAAEEDLLTFKKDNLQIKSPIDGIVLSGSLDRAQAASVRTGQVLFEIGSTQDQQIQLEIPADEIAQISVGNNVVVWIDGHANQPIKGSIQRIFPRSETRGAKNVFIAEFELDQSEFTFRPGMQGSARIDGARHSLAWNLFHKPYEYLKSRLSW